MPQGPRQIESQVVQLEKRLQTAQKNLDRALQIPLPPRHDFEDPVKAAERRRNSLGATQVRRFSTEVRAIRDRISSLQATRIRLITQGVSEGRRRSILTSGSGIDEEDQRRNVFQLGSRTLIGQVTDR